MSAGVIASSRRRAGGGGPPPSQPGLVVATWGDGSSANGASNLNPVVPKPPGTVQGSLLLAFCATQNTGAAWAPNDTGFSTPLVTTPRGALMWKIAGSSEPTSYTFIKGGGGNNSRVMIARIQGYYVPAPIDAASAIDTTVANPVGPSITPAYNHTLLIAALINCGTNIGTGLAIPPGMTERYRNVTTAFKIGATQEVAAGSTGTRQWTAALSTNVAFAVAINAAA